MRFFIDMILSLFTTSSFLPFDLRCYMLVFT